MPYRIMPPPNEGPPRDDDHILDLVVPLNRADALVLSDITSAITADVGRPTSAAEAVLIVVREVAWEAAEDAWREMLAQEGWGQ